MGDLQRLGPTRQERRAREPIASRVHCREGIIESKTPIRQDGEKGKGRPGFLRSAVRSVPAKDGKQGRKCIQGQEYAVAKQKAGRQGPGRHKSRGVEVRGGVGRCYSVTNSHDGGRRVPCSRAAIAAQSSERTGKRSARARKKRTTVVAMVCERVSGGGGDAATWCREGTSKTQFAQFPKAKLKRAPSPIRVRADCKGGAKAAAVCYSALGLRLVIKTILIACAFVM